MKSCIRNGVLAGLLIGIGCIANVVSLNPILGAFLFSLALLTICIFKLSLCTGQFGYINSLSDFKECLITLVFNIIGVAFICFLVKNFSSVSINTCELVQAKINESWYDALVRGFGCGILIYVAVECFKLHYDRYSIVSSAHPLLVIMPVMAFIICGFDHCIANYGYMVLCNVYWTNNFLYWVVGNLIGALFMSKIFYK